MSILVASVAGDVSSGAEGVWAAQYNWCAPPQGDPEPRPHSAGPSRPRSADSLRRSLDVPVDAGMAALGFLSDDAQPTGLSLATTFCYLDQLHCTSRGRLTGLKVSIPSAIVSPPPKPHI